MVTEIYISKNIIHPISKLKVLLRFLLLAFLFFFSTKLLYTQIHIKAAGDCMPGSVTPRKIIPSDSGAVFISSLGDYLKNADICFANLEGAIIDSDIKPNKCSDSSRMKGVCYEFGIPSYLIPTLKKIGFNVFNLDNNHSFDYGTKGFENTKQSLASHGFSYCPPKGHSFFKIKDKKIVIVAFSYENESFNISDIEQSKKIIRKFKSENDIVIVSFHGGGEGSKYQHVEDKTEYFLGENRGNVVRFAHAAIDAGASLVLGHGPHVLRAVELYRNRLIAYSLGNFLTYGNFNISGPNGRSIILDVLIDENSGEFVEGKIIPFEQSPPGIPHFDKDKKAVSIVRELYKSDFPENEPIVDKEGNLIKLKAKKDYNDK